MSRDEFDFPEPEGFDEGSTRYKSNITFGKVVGILGLLAIVGGIAVLIQYAPQLFGDLGLRMQARNRNNPIVIAQRAIAKFNRSDEKGAFEECDKLEKIDPKFGLKVRASFLTRLNRPSETIPVYNKIIALDPTDAEALNNRAYMRALAEVDLEEAVKDIERALEIAGNNPVYIDTRGYLNYLFDRQKLALNDLNTAIRGLERERAERAVREFADEESSNAGLGEIYFHRGLVYRELGETKLSEDDFKAAKAKGFESPNYPKPLNKRGEQKAEAPAK